jgi:5,10-methylenetetrahydromethanopterin reductase
MKLSCGLAPGPEAPHLAALAEEIGYERVWLFDSAPLWEDVFVHLALIAQRTERIGLGTAVLIPTQRHVMTMASAIATIERLAPGRLICGFGTGYTARQCIGQPPMPIDGIRTYLRQLRSLLAGETVDVDGQPCRMLHWNGLTLPRPIQVPLVVSAFGPRGVEMARAVADGRIGLSRRDPADRWYAQIFPGTVLDDGEDARSERVLEAVGPWLLSSYYHDAYGRGPEVVDRLPGGQIWRQALDQEAPPDQRHLLRHQGHVTHITERDRPLLEHMPLPSRFIGPADQVAASLEKVAASGVDEFIYTPAGPGIERELRTFRTLLPPNRED